PHLGLGLGLGAATAAVMEPAPTLNEATLTILVSGTAAMLPDIDDDNSTVNQVLLPFLPASLRSWGLAALGLLVIILYVFRDWPLWTLLSGIYALCVAFADHRGISHSLLALIYVPWMASSASSSLSHVVPAG